MKGVKLLLIIGLVLISLPINSFASEDRYNMSYLYLPNTEDYINLVERTNGSLDTITPDYFGLTEDGQLTVTEKYKKDFVKEMHERGKKVVPFISNHWSKEPLKKALEHPEQLATEIAKKMEEYNLDGINIDFEGVPGGTDEQPTLYRDQFTNFIKILSEKIPANKELSLAVAANPNGWTRGWHAFYDYKKLAELSDHLFIMAYDESWAGGPVGPVASLSFVENSIKYALEQGVPSNKVVLGLPFYGRLWNIDQQGKDVSGYHVQGSGVYLNRIDELLKAFDSNITYVESVNSVKATFTITESDEDFKIFPWLDPLPAGDYVLWYENERSMKQKLNLVQKYNLKGAGSWSLGQEPADMWGFYELWLEGKRFSDVPNGYWATESIFDVEKRGWMLGTSSTEFSPNQKLTRLQAAAILIRALGLQDQEITIEPFKDAGQDDVWAYKEITLAKQFNIITGFPDGTFRPNEEVTREQIATMLFNILNNSTKPANKIVLQKPFTDVTLTRWSVNEIAFMKQLGILTGYPDGTFAPEQMTTRAEMAQLMSNISSFFLKYRLLEYTR